MTWNLTVAIKLAPVMLVNGVAALSNATVPPDAVVFALMLHSFVLVMSEVLTLSRLVG
jgi:hypothetical protein